MKTKISVKNKSDFFAMLLKSETGILPVKELTFAPGRLWRFDYAIPELKIAIEIEGGVFKKRVYTDKRTQEQITTIGGRHNSAKGFLGDIEKYNHAALLGWRIFRTTPSGMTSGEFLELIKKAIDPDTPSRPPQLILK